MKSIIVKEISDPENIPQSNQIKQKKDFRTSSLGVKPLSSAEGIIKAVYSNQNRADVEVNGIIIPRVDVRSMEWVAPDSLSSPTKITGERDLPPIDSKVIIIFPNGIIDNAFILCSVFDPMQKGQDVDFLIEGEERTYLKINEEGWKLSYDKDAGDYILESDSADTNPIKININRTDEYVKIEIGNTFFANLDKGNNIITVQTSADRSIKLDEGNSKTEIKDGSNLIKMDSAGVDINGGNCLVLNT